MAKAQSNRCGENHKRRLLTVKHILEQESDKDHRFSVKQILERLGLDATEANMRAVRSDIRVLKDFGVAIIREKHRTFEYYVGTRALKPDEMKVLVDIVQSSRSIDDQTSMELVESILGLGSFGEAKKLKAGIRLGSRAKTENRQVFHHIDTIQGAIANRHKIQFAYFDIGFDLKRDYRYNGEPRIETPILLTYMNDCFYMVSYNEDKDRINARRLDRMDRVLDTQEKASSNDKISNFNLEEFEYTQFNMFLGDEAKWVTLQINDKKMMNPLYDHFGDRLKGHVTPPKDDKPALVQVKVVPSAQFDGWVYGMNGILEVVNNPAEQPDIDACPAPEQAHYMYVLVCADETLYTGYTTDVKARVAAHNAKKGAKYTAARVPVRLLASAKFATKHEAMSSEYRFKQLSRARKLDLINKADEQRAFEEILADELFRDATVETKDKQEY